MSYMNIHVWYILVNWLISSSTTDLYVYFSFICYWIRFSIILWEIGNSSQIIVRQQLQGTTPITHLYEKKIINKKRKKIQLENPCIQVHVWIHDTTCTCVLVHDIMYWNCSRIYYLLYILLTPCKSGWVAIRIILAPDRDGKSWSTNYTHCIKEHIKLDNKLHVHV